MVYEGEAVPVAVYDSESLLETLPALVTDSEEDAVSVTDIVVEPEGEGEALSEIVGVMEAVAVGVALRLAGATTLTTSPVPSCP
ncbi:MAG: hypothetical protein P4L87_10820 [Formivibrio sp.]|nr:hypothetical protein [Formivibrio sp.]